MVDNGHRRALEFTTAAVLARWVDVLYRAIPERAQSRRIRRWQGKPLWLKASVRRAAGWMPFL